MSSLKELRWGPAPSFSEQVARRSAAALLRGAGALLAHLAAGLASEPGEASSDPCIEYYAEAGAPEGALYVDGRLIGWLAGVRRL